VAKWAHTVSQRSQPPWSSKDSEALALDEWPFLIHTSIIPLTSVTQPPPAKEPRVAKHFRNTERQLIDSLNGFL